MPSRDPMDSKFRRLSYVRYADDFLIGVIGSRKVAEEVMHKVATFLQEKLHLELNLGKTKLTHACKSRAHFLGTDISWNANIEKKPKNRRKPPVDEIGWFFFAYEAIPARDLVPPTTNHQIGLFGAPPA